MRRILAFLMFVLFTGVVLSACTSYYSRPIPFEDVPRPNPVEGFIENFKETVKTKVDSFTPPASESEAPQVAPDSVIIAEPNYDVAYDREAQFGGWMPMSNGCDTRQSILARDLLNVSYDYDGCTVLSGTLEDPYSDSVIDFTRGVDTSRDVQIDHVIPLKYAYHAGAHAWSQSDREAFANSPENLIAVSGSENARKGAKGPSDYLPTTDSCSYATNFIKLATDWELAVAPADYATMEQVCA